MQWIKSPTLMSVRYEKGGINYEFWKSIGRNEKGKKG